MRETKTTILKPALQILALPARQQVEYLNQASCHPADLAAKYITARQGLPAHDLKNFSPQQSALLDTLDQLLGKMINLKVDEVWTAAGLMKHERWIAVRQLACAALQAFEWDGQ